MAAMTSAQWMFAVFIICMCAALPSHLKRQPYQSAHAQQPNRVAAPPQLSPLPVMCGAGTSG
jgi:hypothetical protein